MWSKIKRTEIYIRKRKAAIKERMKQTELQRLSKLPCFVSINKNNSSIKENFCLKWERYL
jgi:hypothetical protein